MNFKEWLFLTEAKKTKDLALEILGNDQNLLNQIRSIIPSNIKQDLQAKLLPLAAYYYKQQKYLNTLKQDLQDYADLVKLNKMPIITVKDDLSIDDEFKNYLHWTEIIHGKKYEDKISKAPVPQGNLEDQELIAQSPDGKIKAYKANSVSQCIILGKGEKFCISQAGNTMFQTYRDTQVSTFYFVYDNTRTDDLAIVVVDATENGILITDRKNETGKTMQDPYSNTPKRIKSNPKLYFKYLKEKGIDKSIFKNIPKTSEEDAEQEKLGEIEKDLDWFKKLSYEEKSKYIGRGHLLSDEQFDYIYDNFALLIKQYVKTGLQMSKYQIQKIATNKDLLSNYIHNRLIANQNNDDLSKEEYELLSPKQKEEIYGPNIDINDAIAIAARVDDFERVKFYIEKGANIYDEELVNAVGVVSYAARNNNFEMVEYLIGKGAYISDSAVAIAAENNNLKMLKYLLEKGAKIKSNAVSYAAKSNNLEMVKYLIEEKGVEIDNGAVSNAAKNNNLEMAEYLVGKGAEISDAAFYAAKNNNFEMVKYLIKNGGKTFGTVIQAIIHNNFEMMEYLVEKGAKTNVSIDEVPIAAKNNNLKMVKYLVGKGASKIGEDAVEYAVINNNLEMARYLIESGYKISDDAVSYAIKNNNLKMVELLVEKGAEINDSDIESSETPEIKNYLIQKQQGRQKQEYKYE